jgi:hypothetical protein
MMRPLLLLIQLLMMHHLHFLKTFQCLE